MSGDVSTLPDTYFEYLREMEKKMKEIQLNEMEKTRRIEEMKRKIAQQGGKINQLRWSNDRLAADCDELLEVNQHMKTVVVAKDKKICSLKKFQYCSENLSVAFSRACAKTIFSDLTPPRKAFEKKIHI